MLSIMIDARRAFRSRASVVALVAGCAACGASGSGGAQASCGERAVPYVVDVPGDYGGVAWYDPGDPGPLPGDDAIPTEDDSAGDDPGDDPPPPDPEGPGDDSTGEGSSGDDTGGDGTESVPIRAQSVAGKTHAMTFDGNVCFSCPLTCTVSTPTPSAGSAVGSSLQSFTDACANAESALRRWAHRKLAAKVTACRVDRDH